MLHKLLAFALSKTKASRAEQIEIFRCLCVGTEEDMQEMICFLKKNEGAEQQTVMAELFRIMTKRNNQN